MFRNFKLAILAFYVATVLLLVVGLYYVVIYLGERNLPLILLVTLSLSVLAGIAIAKIAIEPLQEYFLNLENFSKETLHELNLPINTITANTQMLRRTLDDEKSLKRLSRIETASGMLQERYNELDYLIKRQTSSVERETFELSALLQERIDLLKGLYPKIEFVSDLEYLTLNMDKIGLRKTIDNLIENGVKYSHGEGRIEVLLKERSLQIRDFGIGMSEMELFRIFDRYYQSDAAMPGFGIGLGLVKSFCDKEKIQLHVGSKKGEGTVMTLDFKEVV